jgi:ribonuclease H / adenosylcobalamin/alpha-ribazole phosphatase
VASVNAMPGWSEALGSETTMVLVRHGETDNTVAQVFCGPGGSDPGLNTAGREQVRRAAAALRRDLKVDAVLTSPLRRAQDTAELVVAELGVRAQRADGFRECSFGEWDGLTLQQVRERWPDELDSWLQSHDAAPPGGESLVEVQRRVEEEVRQTLSTYSGGTVVVVTHVNPIKLVVRACLDAPLHSVHRMLVAPASLTVVSFYASGDSVLHQFSATP